MGDQSALFSASAVWAGLVGRLRVRCGAERDVPSCEERGTDGCQDCCHASSSGPADIAVSLSDLPGLRQWRAFRPLCIVWYSVSSCGLGRGGRWVAAAPRPPALVACAAGGLARRVGSSAEGAGECVGDARGVIAVHVPDTSFTHRAPHRSQMR